MFDVMFAMFGGIFLLGRYAYDKVKTDCARADYNTLKNRRELLTYKYAAGTDLCNQIKEYIFCGEHFEDICNSLADDLKYVFGSDWKNKLDIPNGYRVNYSALYPSMHEYWIYHLLLAKRGKFDMWVTFNGFELGYNLNEAKTNVRFAECIEGRLLNAGVEDVKLALECELLCAPDNYRLPTHIYAAAKSRYKAFAFIQPIDYGKITRKYRKVRIIPQIRTPKHSNKATFTALC